MPIIDEMMNELMHYGMPRRSGRYPWGSGKEPFQRTGDFKSRVDELRKSGFEFTDEDGKHYTGDLAIAKSMGLTSTQFRTQYSLAKDEWRTHEAARARSLRDDGYSLNEIAKMMGYNNDSSVRSLLDEGAAARTTQARKTADFLKERIAEKGMLDVGTGVERELGISKEKLREALYILEQEGYPVYGGGIPQVTNKMQQTNRLVLCAPGTEHKEIYQYDKVGTVRDYISYDDGESFKPAFIYPESLDSKRLMINYAEEGGIKKDGVIEIRRGVNDLDLGNSHYAQVRIMVDGTHYLKGMAVYADDLPEGIDIRFNTNKKLGTPQNEVLKKIKDDPENPFGSLIKEHGGQSFYDDPNGTYEDPITGKKQKLSLINKTREEGDWDQWSKELPSQFLSKQNIPLIKKQLALSEANKQEEFEEIMALTNPTIKKAMLKSFADDCDSTAVHLKAASLPRQRYQVILPLDISENEVYAPNYQNGETVALIRYPHGGIFEIPILKVNNKIAEGDNVIGKNAKDAVGISSKVAERLSGADFDGDTVMVIPVNAKTKITNAPALEGLKDFDTKMAYGCDRKETDANGKTHYYRNGKEYKIMNNTQTEMGIVSNLITDMTLKGASPDELAAAVRHSMVVIDAEKHKLDYRQSYVDNNIGYLKKTYQGHIDESDGKYHEGASTIISRAKSEQQVLKRKGSPHYNEDGSVWYNEVEEHYIDKHGKDQVRTQSSTKMAEVKDAYALVNDKNNARETAYADYANKMKSLANQARKEMLSTGNLKYSPEAKKQYSEEVSSLDAKLALSQMNAPKERAAQAMANSIVNAKKKDNPNMTKEEIKKESQRALVNSRLKVGASRQAIEISDKEWEAIQKGAISENKLTAIINNCDMDKLRERATPRKSSGLTTGQINVLKSMIDSGYTNEEIAKRLGTSVSTVIRYEKEE